MRLRKRQAQTQMACVAGTIGILFIALLACASLPSSVTPTDGEGSAGSEQRRDAVHVSLTWDEWGDLCNTLLWATGEISVTLEVAGDVMEPDTVAEAVSTMDRLDALLEWLDSAAVESSAHVPPDELEAILDAQLRRTERFAELGLRLWEARLDALLLPLTETAP